MRLTSLKLRGKKNKKETTQNSSQHQQVLQYNQQQQAFQQHYSSRGSEVRGSSQNSQFGSQSAPMMQKDMDGICAPKDDPFWMRRRYTRDDSFPELTQVLEFMAPTYEPENVSNYAQPAPQRLPVAKKLDEFTPISQHTQPPVYQSPKKHAVPPVPNAGFNQSGSLYNQSGSMYNQAPRMSQKPYMGQGGVALPGMASGGNAAQAGMGYQAQPTTNESKHKRIKKKVHRKKSPEQQAPIPSPQYQPPGQYQPPAQNNQQPFQVPQFRMAPPPPGQMMQAPPPPNKSYAPPGYQNNGYQNQNAGYQSQANTYPGQQQYQSPPKFGMGPPPIPPPGQQQNDMANILMSKTYARQRAQSLSANQNPLAQTVPYNPQMQGNSFTPNNGAPPPPPPKVVRQNPNNGAFQYNNY